MTPLQDDPRTQSGLDPAIRGRILDAFAESPPTRTARSEHRRPGGPVLAVGAASVFLILWFVFYPLARTVVTRRASVPMAASPPPPSRRNWSDAESRPSLGGGYPGGAAPVSAAPRPLLAAAPVDGPALPAPIRRVHQEASITVAMADPEARSDAVERMVKAAGGFVASNTLNTDEAGRKSADMTVKVPEPQFEATLAQIARLGDVQSKNVTGEDITEKVSDAAQAEGVLEDEAQRAEARLKQLGGKAKWSDAEATRDVRIHLAQAQARLHLLKKMAALSTISVGLRQTAKPPVPASTGLTSQVQATTHDALASLAGSTAALLALLIWVLAYAPLWVPVALAIRWAVKHYGGTTVRRTSP